MAGPCNLIRRDANTVETKFWFTVVVKQDGAHQREQILNIAILKGAMINDIRAI